MNFFTKDDITQINALASLPFTELVAECKHNRIRYMNAYEESVKMFPKIIIQINIYSSVFKLTTWYYDGEYSYQCSQKFTNDYFAFGTYDYIVPDDYIKELTKDASTSSRQKIFYDNLVYLQYKATAIYILSFGL